MGKGTIISGGTDGQYQVQLNYDPERKALAIQRLENKITAIDVKIAAETDELKLGVYKLIKVSYQKKIDAINEHCTEDPTVSAWCADLTEDLTGVVGTIEVPGELGTVNIYPGFDGGAVYTITQGQLGDSYLLPPAGSYYNLAMLPAWQKWKPTFRYATITALDGDIASIEYEATESSQQALNINQTDSQDDVEIEYMDCNGAAFEVGDIVLVKFEDQDWSKPKIIGFKDNPKPCDNLIYIRPKFNGCYATRGGQQITIQYMYDGETIEQTRVVYNGESNQQIPYTTDIFDTPVEIPYANDDLVSYTSDPFDIPKKVFEAGTEITVFVGYNYLFYFFEDVGINGDWDYNIRDSYFKRVIKKQANGFLNLVPEGTIAIENKTFDYYEVEFSGLKVLSKEHAFSHSNGDDWDSMSVIDDAYPNCITNTDYEHSTPDYLFSLYTDSFEKYFRYPTQCRETTESNCFPTIPGDYTSTYCTFFENYSTTSVPEYDSLVILTDEYGNNPEFATFRREIVQNLTYWECENCPWCECAGEYEIVNAEQFFLLWTFKMIDTPVDWI